MSEGGFVSTANDFIGRSSRGSLEFFQGALNASAEVDDKLHAGIQLYSADEGDSNDSTPRLDWAFLDYKYQSWLGIRAGRVRIPFGLYNDYIDIDAARLQILLPQSVYPLNDRNVLTAQTGFTLYGTTGNDCLGHLDYQAYGGALAIPHNGTVGTAAITASDSKYVAGGSLFYRPPVDGLRVGASYLRTNFDATIYVAPGLVGQLIAAGLVPADFDGNLTVGYHPFNLAVGSVEYQHDEWLFAAEYSRWIAHTVTNVPSLLPHPDVDNERYYGMVTYRPSEKVDTGVYYSVYNSDVDHRGGGDPKQFAQRFYAWSRDAAATIRYDVTDHWLWKAEAHFIDGAAMLDASKMPTRYWGLFLVRTTVTF